MIKTDIIIIGAGPVGLFTIFEAGLMKLRCHVIDSISTIGGQLNEIYPKKPIYDIPGYPIILAGDLIDNLKKQICNFTNTNNLDSNNTIITNQRHYEQLIKTLAELELVIKGLDDGLSSDLLAINIKESLYHLGLITGEVSSDDLLGNIFGKFCIGK